MFIGRDCAESNLFNGMEALSIGGNGNTTMSKSVAALQTAMTIRGTTPCLHCAIQGSFSMPISPALKRRVTSIILTPWVWKYLP